jgi:hypothetical protein
VVFFENDELFLEGHPDAIEKVLWQGSEVGAAGGGRESEK